MNEEFRKQYVNVVREMAEKADPAIKKRLLEFVTRYESARSQRASIRPPERVLKPPLPCWYFEPAPYAFSVC
jgi:hypothetical protein